MMKADRLYFYDVSRMHGYLLCRLDGWIFKGVFSCGLDACFFIGGGGVSVLCRFCLSSYKVCSIDIDIHCLNYGMSIYSLFNYT